MSTQRKKLDEDIYTERWIKSALSRCVQNENGCWIWQGTKGNRGYAMKYHRDLNNKVHRTLYQLVFGVRLKRWEYACHKCDIPSCINPFHIWIGTPADNQKDMQKKGRGVGVKNKRPPIRTWSIKTPRISIEPHEIRSILSTIGVSQVHGARLIGISERSMRRYIAGQVPMLEPAAIALRALIS